MDLSLAERGTHQGLPNNPDAEANVLSAMLLSSEVVEEALTELLPDDFYRPMNKSLFETMHDMYRLPQFREQAARSRRRGLYS